MKIIWNENPLLTQIMLDEHEKKELWYKIKIEELQETIMSASFHVDQEKHKDMFDLKRAVAELDPEYFCADWKDSSMKGEKSQLDTRVDELFEYYIGDLEHNSHCGDCTCFAASCSKCHAENLLGLDTIKGLGKHEAHAIKNAFTKPGTKFPTRENQCTIDEAIKYLHEYIPSVSWPGAEAHLDRWIQETIRAHKWLEKYKSEHFNS